MYQVIKKTLLIICLFFCAISCDQVNEWTNSALDMVGIGSETKTTKKQKTDLKKAKKKTVKKDTPPKDKQPDKKTDTSKDIVITRDSEDKQKIKKADLKTAVAPDFKVAAPVHVQKRIGGIARFISADDQFIYMDFPQHFTVYDSNLNQLALLPITLPLKQIKRFEKDGDTFLYLKQENDVLEILQLSSSKVGEDTVYTLKETKSIEMQGDFYWIDANLIAVFFADKVQFRDFSDINQIKIINETPISQVTSAYAVKNSLFLARDQFLDIINLNTFDLVSSVRIGKDFTFLGVLEQNGHKNLLLGYLDPERQLEGIQYLRLTDDETGITNFGENILFPLVLQNYSIDLDEKLIIGREVSDDALGPVQLFSLKYKRFLRGMLSTETRLRAWSFDRSILYLVNDKEITANQVVCL